MNQIKSVNFYCLFDAVGLFLSIFRSQVITRQHISSYRNNRILSIQPYRHHCVFVIKESINMMSSRHNQLAAG